jgi:deoxycytidylate deaminase
MRMLEKIASNIQHDSMNYKHAALLGVKYKIISIGVNKEKTSPLQDEYKHSDHCVWTHAEVDCLSNTLIPKKATLYVIRVNKQNKFMLSKPCEGCQKLIERKEIKRVIYSDYDNVQEMILD